MFRRDFTGFVIYLTLIVYQQQHLFIVFFLAVFLGVFFFTTFFFATFFFAIAIPPNQDFALIPDGAFAPCHHLLPKTFYIVNNLSAGEKQMQHLFIVERMRSVLGGFLWDYMILEVRCTMQDA
jgi:hypothetical protein